MADLKGKEMEDFANKLLDDIKTVADGLAVDSRKESVSCVDLAHRIEQALLDLQQQTERRVRRETLEPTKKILTDALKWFEIHDGATGNVHLTFTACKTCDVIRQLKEYLIALDALKKELE